VRTGRQDALGTTLAEVVKSHLTVFAAETSRREGRVVDCVEFERTVREKVATARKESVVEDGITTANGTDKT
jgi:hypothetical protein